MHQWLLRWTPVALLLTLTMPVFAGDDDELIEFLRGTWVAEKPSGRQVEHWWAEPTRPGLLGRGMELSEEGDTVFVETLELRHHLGKLTYFATVPGNDGPIAFPTREVRSRGDRVEHEFFNPDHDFPRRLIYARIGEDSLVVTVDDGAFEEPRGFQLRFRRADGDDGG